MAIHIDNGFSAFGTFVQSAARCIPAATGIELSQTIDP